MLFKKFDRQEADKPIRAGTINDPLDAIEAALKVTYVAPLEATRSGGTTTVRLLERRSIYAKLTSGTGVGPYAWTSQEPATGGTWTNGFMTDSSLHDPAFNTINATPTLPVIVEMRRNSRGAWTFTTGTC